MRTSFTAWKYLPGVRLFSIVLLSDAHFFFFFFLFSLTCLISSLCLVSHLAALPALPASTRAQVLARVRSENAARAAERRRHVHVDAQPHAPACCRERHGQPLAACASRGSLSRGRGERRQRRRGQRRLPHALGPVAPGVAVARRRPRPRHDGVAGQLLYPWQLPQGVAFLGGRHCASCGLDARKGCSRGAGATKHNAARAGCRRVVGGHQPHGRRLGRHDRRCRRGGRVSQRGADGCVFQRGRAALWRLFPALQNGQRQHDGRQQPARLRAGLVRPARDTAGHWRWRRFCIAALARGLGGHLQRRRRQHRQQRPGRPHTGGRVAPAARPENVRCAAPRAALNGFFFSCRPFFWGGGGVNAPWPVRVSLFFYFFFFLLADKT